MEETVFIFRDDNTQTPQPAGVPHAYKSTTRSSMADLGGVMGAYTGNYGLRK